MADSSDEGPTAASPTEVTADCSWMVSAAADALTKKAQAGAEENPERKRELCKYYDELVESVNDSEDTVSMCGWLAALTQCVSKITDDCSRLLAAVLSREWAGSATTATKFTTFLCHLVSANGCFVEAALGVLVQHMLPREGALDVEFVSDIVHDANFQILRIFPASSGCLSRLLQDNFPHKRLSAATHATYLRNVLRIVTCAPALQNDVLRCVVGKCIQLDVDIKMDDLGEDEEEEDEVVPFQMDEMEDTAAGGDSKHEKSAAETETEKLDEMMDLLFAFIKRQCSDRSEAGRKQAENIFKILMRIFHSMILTTHNSKFVQYLMFFICSLNPEFTDAFLQATGDAAVSTATPLNLRLACAAHVSSFVGRASFVQPEKIKEVLEQLVHWAHAYIATARDVARPDSDAHAIFYAISQAICYIICYRHTHILAQPDGLAWVRALDLRRIIECTLNPLRLCHPGVTAVFTVVMRNAKALDCTAIVDENAAAPALSNGTDSQNRLHAYFPFDPYLLPRSDRHLIGLHLGYNECIGDEVDAEVGWDDSASDSQSNGCTTPSNSSLDSSYNGGSASQSFVMPNSVEHMLLSPNY